MELSSLAMTGWLIGRASNPLNPLLAEEGYSYNHRYDDPQRVFRTVHVASELKTALMEALCDLRPGAVQANKGLPYGLVSAEWRSKHVAVCVDVRATRRVLDLTTPSARSRARSLLAPVLMDHRLDYLDLGELTSPDPSLTCDIARFLYDRDYAGVLYPSSLNNGRCCALFERRGFLEVHHLVNLKESSGVLDGAVNALGLILEPITDTRQGVQFLDGPFGAAPTWP